MSTIKPILTSWSKAREEIPLNEYPRPQLERKNWTNLNGKWDYAITKSMIPPIAWEGKIIVPFSPESILSGVEKTIKADEYLWYKKAIVPSILDQEQRLILHFGAVDQNCKVFCNNVLIGHHEGGYLPFSFDITSFVDANPLEIMLCVTDITDKGDEAYGKQSSNRGGIWYTPTTGIWQTVWTEIVPRDYITSIAITPLFDESVVMVKAEGKFSSLTATVLENGFVIASESTDAKFIRLHLNKFTPWTPDNPHLYDLIIKTETDEVKSYFGMRKFSSKIDANGNNQFMLNNKPIFQSGLLDQGYWSDGLYTVPSDKAFIWEIEKLKDLGFNMLRKHIKIEPLRWYYHCDKLGMLVWQDAVSGGNNYKKSTIQVLPFIGIKRKDDNYKAFGRESLSGREKFKKDLTETLDLLRNVVSLCVWVPFNEGWGQFNAKETNDYVKSYDPTRLVDHASGWHDQGSGDFNSVHIYYKKFRMKNDKYNRIQALTEFGGFSCPIEVEHMASDTLFGYKMYKGKDELSKAIDNLYRTEIIPQIKKGLSVTIYTQVSDVEDEINGIFSYDREVIKVDQETIKNINKDIYNEFNKTCKMS